MKKTRIMIMLGWALLLMVPSVTVALIDPTRPANYVPSGASSTSLTLSAILYSHHRKLAVINGQVMKAGDEISGDRLVVIKENSVLLDGPNGRVELFLLEQSIFPDKKRPTQ